MEAKPAEERIKPFRLVKYFTFSGITVIFLVIIMLSVLNPAHLRERFRGRGQKIDKRRAERYLQHFDEIWRLQSYLLSEADRGQVPIFVNNAKDQVIRDIMSVVMDALVDRLDAPPSDVFT